MNGRKGRQNNANHQTNFVHCFIAWSDAFEFNAGRQSHSCRLQDRLSEGGCSHDPLGKEEVQAQLLQLQHRRDRIYLD